MCLAVPSVVVSVDGMMATVEAFGTRRDVSLLLLEDEVAIGDYLVIQAGGHAFEKLDPESARASLALMQEILREGGADVRAW